MGEGQSRNEGGNNLNDEYVCSQVGNCSKRTELHTVALEDNLMEQFKKENPTYRPKIVDNLKYCNADIQMKGKDGGARNAIETSKKERKL